MAQSTSGRRIHPCSCRQDVVATERLGRVTGRVEASGSKSAFGRASNLAGRNAVEVLLTPNTYLRLGENSGIRMISNSLANTRVELLRGSAMLQSADVPAGTSVTIILKDSAILLLRPGNYRVDAEPPQLRVHKGEAEVSHNGNTLKVGDVQLYALDGAPVVKRFTDGSDDLLDMWAQERSILISHNLSDARTIFDPLIDPGPNGTDGLNAYLGYVPLIAVPTLINDPSYGVYGGYGLYGGPGGYSFLPDIRCFRYMGLHFDSGRYILTDPL
jgi:hypothetical protein